MKANLNQLSFTDIYSNIDEYFQQDKPKLIKLFEQHIDLQNLIPQSFYNHYHSDTGHPRSTAQHVPGMIPGTKALTINKTERLSSQELTISRRMPGNKYFKK